MSNLDWQERTELLLGKEGLESLRKAKVLVVGLGGVGAYAAEMLVRAGIGNIHIIDGDQIQSSNRNRQILALQSVLGQDKASLMKTRLLDINPHLEITAHNLFIKGEMIEQILAENFDYVLDAIDTLAPKIFLISGALKRNLRLISSMGSGGKTNPAMVQIADFSETYNDKLAKMLRKRIHKQGIYSGFKVVFSSEQTNPNAIKFVDNEQNKKTTVGTISYMPPIFGSFMAAEVIRSIAQIEDFKHPIAKV
jgi:tRNA A37 threonylcarbamoyladenosine dehydratase